MAGFIPKEEAISGLYMRLSGDDEVFGHKDFINDLTVRGDLEISGNMRVSQTVDFTSQSGDIAGNVFRGETGYFNEIIVGETTIGGEDSQIGSSVFVGQTGYFDEIIVGEIKADSSNTGGGESSGGLDTGPVFVRTVNAVNGVREIIESDYGGEIIRKVKTASDQVDVGLMVERGDAQAYKPSIFYSISGSSDPAEEIDQSSLSLHPNGYSFNSTVRLDSSSERTYLFKNGSRQTYLIIEKDTPPQVISAEFINRSGTNSFYGTSSFNSESGNVTVQQTEAKSGDTARVKVVANKAIGQIYISGGAVSSKTVNSPSYVDNLDGTYTHEFNVDISASSSPSDRGFTVRVNDLVGNSSENYNSDNTITTNNQTPSGNVSVSIVPTTVVSSVQVRIGTGHGQWPNRYVYVNLTGIYLGVTSTTLSFGQPSNEFYLSGDGKTLSIKISSSSPTVSWFEAWVNGSIADASAGRSHTYNGQAGSGISNGHGLFSNQVSTRINTAQVPNTTGIINNTTDRVNFNVSASNFDHYNFSKSGVFALKQEPVGLTSGPFQFSAENANSRTSGNFSVQLFKASNGRTTSFSSSSVQIQSFGTVPSLNFSPNTFSSSNSGAILNNVTISLGEEVDTLSIDSVSDPSISIQNLTKNNNKSFSFQISVDDSSPRGTFTINFAGTKIIGDSFSQSDTGSIRGFNQRTVTALATAYEPVDLGVEIYSISKLIVSVQPDGGNSFSVNYDPAITGAKQDGSSNLEAAFGIVDGNKIVIDNQVITNAGNVNDVFITVEEPK